MGSAPLFDVHRVQEEAFKVFQSLTALQKKGCLYLQKGPLHYSLLLWWFRGPELLVQPKSEEKPNETKSEPGQLQNHQNITYERVTEHNIIFYIYRHTVYNCLRSQEEKKWNCTELKSIATSYKTKLYQPNAPGYADWHVKDVGKATTESDALFKSRSPDFSILAAYFWCLTLWGNRFHLHKKNV